ncbi:MAG: DUF4345 domain-containing protein [Bacteroidota bacterium]
MNWILKNLHLIISVSIVAPTAIIYGSPSILAGKLDIQVNTVDLSNLLKAVMGLYLGASVVWILGIFKNEYWRIATQLNILFMLALGAGRVISMLVDGLPTDGYIFGVIAELALGIFAIYQLKKYGSDK